jgi:hypothetical protein
MLACKSINRLKILSGQSEETKNTGKEQVEMPLEW